MLRRERPPRACRIEPAPQQDAPVFRLLVDPVGSAASAEGVQIVEIFRACQFRGRLRGALTWAFFVIMPLIFSLNLAVCVAGAGDFLSSLTGLSARAGSALFSVFAAGVGVLGLRALGVSEKVGVVSMLALLAVLFVGTMNVSFQPLPLYFTWHRRALGLFGVVMFCFASFFAVPQVVEGMRSRPDAAGR